MSGILEGIKVLDFTRVISGPTATQYLADMGAEVIKVEPPKTGDVMRNIAPVKNGQSGFYITLNRGKKGITLDMKDPRGREIALKLAERADVLVENFSPGTMKDLGLDLEAVRERNPKIIYASLSGYGQYGPNSGLVSYDLCIQAMCGLMQMNGYPGMPPCRIGFSVTDYFAGMLIAMGVVAALYKREQTGKGEFIDVSMFDAGLAVTENAMTRFDMLGEIPSAIGSRHPAASPHNVYKTKDGYIALIVIEDGGWKRLTEAMGKPELQKDPDLAKALNRLKQMDRLDKIVGEWTGAHTTAELIPILNKYRLAYGVVKTAKDLVEDPHAIERGMVVKIYQTGYGPLRIPGNPIKFADDSNKAEVRGPAPLLGEHNKDVICGILGYTENEFMKFIKDGVI
jgi:crotonobetainyl-CoA:carnitine CoA-transferase CaiB-like acyl-CoA transferase